MPTVEAPAQIATEITTSPIEVQKEVGAGLFVSSLTTTEIVGPQGNGFLFLAPTLQENQPEVPDIPDNDKQSLTEKIERRKDDEVSTEPDNPISEKLWQQTGGDGLIDPNPPLTSNLLPRINQAVALVPIVSFPTEHSTPGGSETGNQINGGEQNGRQGQSHPIRMEEKSTEQDEKDLDALKKAGGIVETLADISPLWDDGNDTTENNTTESGTQEDQSTG